MASYVCYGLSIRSDLALPELTPAGGAPASVDVVIELAPVGDPPASALSVADGLWQDGSACWLAVPDVARFQALDGRRIAVEPVPGAEERAIRLFLLGTMMGAIMMQRGHLVLHGNAVRVGDACAVVVGHSGAGKSTLAAEFARRGLPVLSDDVVPLDAAGCALAGYPRVKLWADTLEQFGFAADGLERVRSQAPKYSVPIAGSDDVARPVRWIYALETGDAPSIMLSAVKGIAKFQLLSEHTYRRQLLVEHAARWEHAQLCAAVAAQARVAVVRRPAATMTPAATADAILADIGAQQLTESGPTS